MSIPVRALQGGKRINKTKEKLTSGLVSKEAPGRDRRTCPDVKLALCRYTSPLAYLVASCKGLQVVAPVPSTIEFNSSHASKKHTDNLVSESENARSCSFRRKQHRSRNPSRRILTVGQTHTNAATARTEVVTLLAGLRARSSSRFRGRGEKAHPLTGSASSLFSSSTHSLERRKERAHFHFGLDLGFQTLVPVEALTTVTSLLALARWTSHRHRARIHRTAAERQKRLRRRHSVGRR